MNFLSSVRRALGGNTTTTTNNNHLEKQQKTNINDNNNKNKSPNTSSPKNNTNGTGDVSILHIARKNSKSNILKANDALKKMSTKIKSSFTQRKIREDEIGKEFVEIRMVCFEKACINNRTISLKSEYLIKQSTSECNALKRKKESWEQFENELNNLKDINAQIEQINIDVDQIYDNLVKVENLLEDVCVLDISLQHLKWERKLENSIQTHKQKESLKLLRKRGEKRASSISKDISQNFSRLLRSASITSSDGGESPKIINEDSIRNDNNNNNDKTSDDNNNNNDEASDASNNKDSSDVIPTTTGEEDAKQDESDDSDKEFDPTTLYND